MAHDDVIEDLNIKKLASLDQGPGHSNIVGTGSSVTARMIVGYNDTRSIALERGAKDLTQPDLG